MYFCHAAQIWQDFPQLVPGLLVVDNLQAKVDIESRLRRAVENGELELHYQPQIDLATNRISGAESLLRWSDPDLGAVSPAEFIPIAEEFGLIVPISEWVIQEACQQALRWQTLDTGPITMSINVSAVHFNGRELESLITRTLEQTGIEPASIELELTETGILHDPDLSLLRGDPRFQAFLVEVTEARP